MTTFSVSQQHYLFGVQSFAHTILALGGDEVSYALRDRTTRGVIDDVAQGLSEVGVVMQTTSTKEQLDAAFDVAGLAFTELAQSTPRVALPSSHPLVNAKSLTLEQLADWPYLRFEQEANTPAAFAEEAFGAEPRSKVIACTDRATLSELIVALNGYTITSGILVGISDGSALNTLPLETEEKLLLGYLTRKGAVLSKIGARFVEKLEQGLKRYAQL